MVANTLDFLHNNAALAAPRLLGCILERTVDGSMVRVKIVETEAYDQTDAASHSYKGPTPRTDVMFGPAGHLYVYFTYGLHHCCNIVTGQAGVGEAVLIRAVEPLAGSDSLLATNGPARLCKALGINLDLNGHDLAKAPLRLIPQSALSASEITTTTRIGISKAQAVPWRFYITNNPYISKL